MQYRIVKKVTSPHDGSERTTVAVGHTLVTIKGTAGFTERQLVIAIYNEMIRLEPTMVRRQDLARERHAYETSGDQESLGSQS